MVLYHKWKCELESQQCMFELLHSAVYRVHYQVVIAICQTYTTQELEHFFTLHAHFMFCQLLQPTMCAS